MGVSLGLLVVELARPHAAHREGILAGVPETTGLPGFELFPLG